MSLRDRDIRRKWLNFVAQITLSSWIIVTAGLFWGCGGCCGNSASTRAEPVEGAVRYRRFDAHAHISPLRFEEALELYRRYGVEATINVSGRYPRRGLEQAVEASRRSGGRYYFMCNIPWQFPVDHPRFLSLALAVLESCFEAGAIGWKIHKILGLGAVYSDGMLVPVDAPELDPLFERAADLGLPVLIHSGDPKAFFEAPTPDNERYEELQAHPGWSFHGDEFPSWEEIFNQFERRVARHPHTTFIGAHFGNAPEEPQRVERMLEQYPNYFIDTAARIPEIGRHDPEHMREFFIRFQDRILFATDLGFGRDMYGRQRLTLGSSGDEQPTTAEIETFWRATYRYFETRDVGFPNPTPIQGRWPISGIGLPREVLDKIYRMNAERLFRVRIPASRQERRSNRR